MVVRADRFTPEVLLSAPRFSPALPNHDGTLALFIVSQYSFETKVQKGEIRILDLKTGQSQLFSNDENAHDPVWLGDGTNAIIWLQSGAKSITSIMIGDGDKPDEASYTADVILAPFRDLKVTNLSHGAIGVVMSGQATSGGSLWNEETDNKSPSTARIYDRNLVRFWDKYLPPQKSVLWYSKLVKSNGKYSLAAPVHNALKGTDLECPFYNPLGSSINDFDISPLGILFWSNDPKLDMTRDYAQNIYFVPLKTFVESTAPEPRKIKTQYDGAFGAVKFSPCGQKAAFLQGADKRDSADTRIILWDDLRKLDGTIDVLPEWHLNPGSLEWSSDGEDFLFTAATSGRNILYTLPTSRSGGKKPQALTRDGAVSYALPLGKTKELLVTSTSIVESNVYHVIDIENPLERVIISSYSKNGLKFGLSHNQVSET
jgi:hypothetical protein